jgi:hypothetical protein
VSLDELVPEFEQGNGRWLLYAGAWRISLMNRAQAEKMTTNRTIYEAKKNE